MARRVWQVTMAAAMVVGAIGGARSIRFNLDTARVETIIEAHRAAIPVPSSIRRA